MPDEWWTRLDLNIPEKVPDDLTTPEACTRYVRRKLRELAQAERDYEAVKEAEGEDACVQLRQSLDRLTDLTADLIHEVTLRMARLEAEAPRHRD